MPSQPVDKIVEMYRKLVWNNGLDAARLASSHAGSLKKHF
jgi:hypothetical protein